MISYAAKFAKDTSDKDALNASPDLHAKLTAPEDVPDFYVIAKVHRKRAGKEDDGTRTAAVHLVHVEALDGDLATQAQRIADQLYRKRCGRANVEDEPITGWWELEGAEVEPGEVLAADVVDDPDRPDYADVVDDPDRPDYADVVEAEPGPGEPEQEEADDDLPEGEDDGLADEDAEADEADAMRNLPPIPGAEFRPAADEWDMAADLKPAAQL